MTSKKYNPRKSGAEGNEPRGRVKVNILNIIYSSKSPLELYEIADILQNSLIDSGRSPIRQRQGIYRHITELASEELGLIKIIRNEKKGFAYSYTSIEHTLDNFKILTRFLLENKFIKLIKFPTFQEFFVDIFPSLIQEFTGTLFLNLEGINVNSVISFIAKSETALRLLILEPKKLKTLSSTIYLNDWVVDKIEKKAMPKFNNTNMELFRKGMLKLDNPNLSVDEIEDRRIKFNELIIELIPGLALCYYYDILEEFIQSDRNDNEFNAQWKTSWNNAIKEFGLMLTID
jgi:hypothetical protein